VEERSDQEIDLETLWRGIRRLTWWIVGLPIFFTVLVFFVLRSQAPMFEAASTIISSNSGYQGQDGIINNAMFKAPPLPEGAVAQALQSTLVIYPLIQTIKNDPHFSSSDKSKIISKLTKELRQGKLTSISLISRIDSGGNGIYTVTAYAGTAQGAQHLADLTTQALLNWDAGRAKANILRAKLGFQAQLTQIEEQIGATSSESLEYRTLISRRATVQDSLVQTSILEGSATGVLSLLSTAVEPVSASSPQPLRNAFLVFLVTIIATIAFAAFRTLLDRTIRSEDDLLSLNISTLGIIPRLRKRDVVFNGIVRAARHAGLYESVGFCVLIY